MKLIRNILAIAALAGALPLAAEPYKIIAPMPDDADGAMARLVNFDTGDAIDSVLVAERVAVFEGNIDEPILARILVDGNRMPTFILESGTISFNAKEGPFGTMLNDELRKLSNEINALQSSYQQAPTDAEKEVIYNKYIAKIDSTMEANADNAFGFFVFLNGGASSMAAPALRETLKQHPSFAKYARTKKMLESAERREATQPGGKYIDFEVKQPDGTVKKLSDYVGRGKYTLVDFWASWCGPCIRQTAVLKDIYNKYKDDGRLDVLGVAVWDEVDATKKAIAQHELPWECILDAQTIPTDLYGITGIPCIILFGPDGTIISRDKQDDELKADVDAALAK